MSGICGAWALDGGAPDLAPVLAKLERRGPDGTNRWAEGSVALGHTLLATTPEALVEVLPLTEADSGCTITADVRLDNREELIAALDLGGETRVIGDGELILRAYLKWGEECPTHLLGDFAFAIWDPREPRLFCARDHMGMRQLIYHHAPGTLFAFATEADALVAHSRVANQISEGRIADFLDDLEGIDLTSTFFENMYRLPPAHALTVDDRGPIVCRYWELIPGPQLNLDSDQAYADEFLKVFTQAVHCRLRSAGPVGSMLSGGMDSNSVAAVAARILMAEGSGPLVTVSAIGPDPDACPESRAIARAVKAPGIAPLTIDYSTVDLDREMVELTRDSAEPFDGQMTLVRAVYRTAHRAGLKVMLDGVGGDVVLTGGNRVAALLREGHVHRAIAEARGERRFWGPSYRLRAEFSAALWSALAPQWLRITRRQVADRWSDRRWPGGQRAMTRQFASAVNLRQRRSRLRMQAGQGLPFGAAYQAIAIGHPHLVVARERYDRVAAQFGIEPRDPFLDIRLIQFCLSLPGAQLQSGGWPKMILRRAMTGTLPEQLLWRSGKAHHGWRFNEALMDRWEAEFPFDEDPPASLAGFVGANRAADRSGDNFKRVDRQRQFALVVLTSWLRRNQRGGESLTRDGE